MVPKTIDRPGKCLNIPAILATILVASIDGNLRTEFLSFSQYSERKISLWSHVATKKTSHDLSLSNIQYNIDRSIYNKYYYLLIPIKLIPITHGVRERQRRQ